MYRNNLLDRKFIIGRIIELGQRKILLLKRENPTDLKPTGEQAREIMGMSQV